MDCQKGFLEGFVTKQSAGTCAAARDTTGLESAVYRFGAFRLDPVARQLFRGDTLLHLQSKAFDLLVVLVQNAGRTVSKTDLMAAVWPDAGVEEANLSVHMTPLRRALGEEGERFIETVPKQGYRFVAPVQEVEKTAPADAQAAAGSATPRWRWTAAAIAVAVVSGVAIGSAYLVMRNARPADAGVGAPIRSLVVVPFDAIDPASDQQHLEFGMAEALITRLGNLQGLRVPPTAALRRDEDPFDAGDRLNVDAVLSGTVQRSGDRLRVTAQLSRVSDRGQIWAGVFDENFTHIFDVQDSIAERIALSVGRDVSARERAALHRQETRNIAAYELYLKGRERWSHRTMATIQEAILMYESAIALDPEFALAYAGLADAYTTTASGLPPAVRHPRARAAADKAVALAPALAEAHVALGFVSYKFEWKWTLAEQEFRRAIALDPNHSLAYHQFGELHKLLGKWDEAIADFQKARELDPYLLHTRMDLQSMYLIKGRIAEARELIEAGLKQDPHSWEMNQGLAEVLEAEGRMDESIEADLRSRLLAGAPAHELETLRAAYRDGGKPAYLRKENEFLRRRFEQGANAPKGLATSLARNFALLRDREQTLHWVTVASERQEEGPLYLNYRHYEFVRDDPRFKALYARVFGS